MKVLLINGSPKTNGNTAFALDQMVDTFRAEGIETEIIQVGNQSIRGCTACGGCYRLGKCVFDDLVNEVAEKLQNAEGIVVASPRILCIAQWYAPVIPRPVVLQQRSCR